MLHFVTGAELIRKTPTVRSIGLRGTGHVLRALGFLVPLLVGSTAAWAGSVIIFVDDTASSGGDGASWATAYPFLQDALAFASNPDNGVTEIHVGQGLYVPDRDEATPGGTGDREATFQLVSGVALMGGYAGLGEPDPDDRDVTQHVTLLSGDLALDDGPGFANNQENAFQVVTGSGVDPTAVLDGFTITAGNANAIHVVDNGAGMNNDGGSPTVMHCTFTGNSAGTNGGGMYNTNGSPVVTGCLFLGNVAGFGGGLANVTANSTVVGCAFIGNSASDAGGMLNVESSPAVTNTVFIDNTAVFEGGGLYSHDLSCPIVTNCTFTGNSAATGGGLRTAALSDALVSNTILWANAAPEGPEISLFLLSTISVAYSNVQGGLAAIAVDRTSSVTWRPIPGSVDHVQRLPRARQRDHQRVVTPDCKAGIFNRPTAPAFRVHACSGTRAIGVGAPMRKRVNGANARRHEDYAESNTKQAKYKAQDAGMYCYPAPQEQNHKPRSDTKRQSPAYPWKMVI